MNPTSRGMWLAAAMLMTLLRAGQAQGDDSTLDALLSRERWREYSYGVSIRPPLGCKLRNRTADDALLQIDKDKTYTVRLYIKRSNIEMTIDQIVKAAMDQFGFMQPTSVKLDELITRPAGRPGWIIYFGVNLPQKDKPRPSVDRVAIAKVARTQLETANTLFKNGEELRAYFLYKAVAMNSPEATMRARANTMVQGLERDRAFRKRLDNFYQTRKRTHPHGADENKPWIMGQAFMKLSPTTFVTLQVETAFADYKHVKKTFEAIVRSIEVKSPRELDAERKDLLKKGDVWRNTLDYKRLSEGLLPAVSLPIVDDRGRPAGTGQLRLQYYRVTQNESDIGWMKIVHRRRRDRVAADVRIDPKTKKKVAVFKEAGVEGLGVDVYLRLHYGKRAIDSLSEHFLSADGNFESWSIRTTVRSRRDFKDGQQKPPTKRRVIGADGKPRIESDEVSAIETGVRNREQITIVRESPSGIRRYQWNRPPLGYISQVELFLSARLLPRKPFEYGFYAYYPKSGTITFRTVRGVPEGDGTYRIYSRPTPDEIEQISHYDAKGNLIKRELADGMEIVPTTRQELARIWNIELKDNAEGKAPADQPPTPSRDRVPR